MPSSTRSANPLSRYIAGPLRVEAPDVAGALAVFPVFGPDPQLSYLAFSQALPLGVVIKELGEGASVNDLLVHNPTDGAVLLYEGEEVLGAQQNRTFDVSILVAAGASLKVPVSCVEAGRWDGARHNEAFSISPQAAYPELRRAKARAVRERLAADLDARAQQNEVWQDVAAKSARLGAHSPTGALHDVYEHRRIDLDAIRGQVSLRPGQIGALVSIGGRFAVLDLVSRSEVYAALHAPLLQGYALDALGVPEGGVPDSDEATSWLASLADVGVSERDGIGVGVEVRFEQDHRAGSGLVAGEELVQLSVFAENGGIQGAQSARIRRPSRRRAN